MPPPQLWVRQAEFFYSLCGKEYPPQLGLAGTLEEKGEVGYLLRLHSLG